MLKREDRVLSKISFGCELRSGLKIPTIIELETKFVAFSLVGVFLMCRMTTSAECYLNYVCDQNVFNGFTDNIFIFQLASSNRTISFEFGLK